MANRPNDRAILANLLARLHIFADSAPSENNFQDWLRIIDTLANADITLRTPLRGKPSIMKGARWSTLAGKLELAFNLRGNLVKLKLTQCELAEFPPDILQFSSLHHLDLSQNQLTSLPAEVGQLNQLRRLNVSENHLTSLPTKVGQLISLLWLFLQKNKLTALPAEVGQLAQLQGLDLHNNQLTQLPLELGQLAQLQRLDLSGNQLTQLPLELGHLTTLERLDVDDNPDLLSPPPEIVSQGTSAMLAFLRELEASGTVRHEAKLVVVGEGGTGKSSLLRALRDEPFDPNLKPTHGIEVGSYCLPHPDQPATDLTLNTWDFGGQHIYHATHQFFLTHRSLYLVVWNARLGGEQGRLNYWLDTIKALAPDAPVLLVATHIDERAPDVNYQLYHEAYPNLVGNLAISNQTGAGIDELKAALAKHAARLPLMGQPWPQTWIDAEQALLARPEHHIDAAEYRRVCDEHNVDEQLARGTLADYLHDLGKILYFRDDDVLSNLVVLKPNWVTKAINRVLTDDQVNANRGILQHADLPRIWATDEHGQRYEQHRYPIFLALMEKFELSYQLAEAGERRTASLVPQLLPHQPPPDLPPWPGSPPASQAQVEMIYHLGFVPAGIMSRFIVRTHRYTLNLHWREGVMLAYEGHQARVELNPMLREIRLQVRGQVPENFFTILMKTMDEILKDFRGLEPERRVPCICHRQREAAEPCTYLFQYEHLIRYREKGRDVIDCRETLEEVSVLEMLYGIHRSTDREVMEKMQRTQQQVLAGQQHLLAGQQEIRVDIREHGKALERIQQLSEWLARNFTRQWNLEMHKLEAECPNIFYLMPGSRSRFDPRNWVSDEYTMYLVCQHPPAPHGVVPGYSVRQPEEWWQTISPWFNHLIQFLKFAVPMGGKIAGVVYDEVTMKEMQSSIALIEEITKNIPNLPELDSKKHMSSAAIGTDRQAEGPALRALYHFLQEQDPPQRWGDLHKVVTPDGNILWLCPEHRAQYQVPLLQLDAVYHA